MSVVVRQVGEADLEVLRRLRLDALARAPGAFAATLADEQALSASAWGARLASNAAGERTVAFVAEMDGLPLGLVVGVRAEGDAEASLNALWVDPAVRGRGAGRALIEAVCRWAASRGSRRVVLCVLPGHDDVVALYERCGFAVTGQACGQVTMARELA